jgi:hypothetical protein
VQTDAWNQLDRRQERNRYFFPDSSRGKQDIFKRSSEAFGFDEVVDRRTTEDDTQNGRPDGSAAAIQFWATTSKDEIDEAQDWKDLDPEIDQYSDTEVQDDGMEKVTSTTRLIASMNFPEHESISNRTFRRTLSNEEFDLGAEKPMKQPPSVAPRSAEIDPFSLEAFAAMSSATPKTKKSTKAFDPFVDAFGDSVNFSSNQTDLVFAPSSASDLSSKNSKKNQLPTIAGPKKDTKPINEYGFSRKRRSPKQQAKADSGVLNMSGTPPRSPTRRTMNVDQIQEDLDNLAPSGESQEKNHFLRAPSGDDAEAFSPKSDEFAVRRLNDTVWSFEQGISSYEAQDRYDADVETFDIATLDDSHSHPCEI